MDTNDLSTIGGQGAGGDDSAKLPTRSEIRMIQQALNNNWKIPAEVFNNLPQHIAKIFLDSSSTRAKISAAKVLMMMSSANRNNAQLAVDVLKADAYVTAINEHTASGKSAASVIELESGLNYDRAEDIAGLITEFRRIGGTLCEDGQDIRQSAPTDE